MEEEQITDVSVTEPSLLLVWLGLVVAAMALKVVLTSAREAERTRGWRASTRALWPGVLAWGLGLWAAGLLAVAGLEPVADLRFNLSDAAWLLLGAVLSGVPPMWWLARRHARPRSTRRLGGAALLLALPGVALSMGWLQAARLEPAPLWLPLWAVLGGAVATVGLAAALALAYSTLGEAQSARRLWRSAAAVAGGVALLLGQVLVHEAALVSAEAFSRASATLSVALMSGVGALSPLLLLGLMVLQRLRRYAHEDRRHSGSSGLDRRRHRRPATAAGQGDASRPFAASGEASGMGDSASAWSSSLPSTAAQPRRRSKHRRHRVL